MKKFLMTFFILIFNFVVLSTGVVLLDSLSVVENQSGGGISQPDDGDLESPDIGIPDEDINPNANTEFAWTVKGIYWTSSSNYSSAYAGANDTNAADSKVRFGVYWKDEKKNSATLKSSAGYTLNAYPSAGYTVGGDSDSSTNLKYVYYGFWNIFTYKRYIKLDLYNVGTSYCFGVSTGTLNSSCRSRNASYGYIYNGATTNDETTAANNCSQKLSGTYYVHYRQGYTVTYNANGGTNTPSSQTIYAGIGYNITSSVPTRTGYTFQGWSTSSSSGTIYNGGYYFDDSYASGNKTYYARWTANTYGISYNANGGSMSGQASFDGVTNISGYSFSLNSAGYYVSGNAGIDNSYSLCRVNFTANAGTNVTFSVINYAETNYDFGIFSNLNTSLSASNTEDTTNVFRSFKGSSMASEQTVTYTISSSGSYYIYVKYRKDSSNSNNYDSLQFRMNGKSVTYGSSYGTLPTPTRTHYNFLGWYTSTSYTTQITSSTTVSTASHHTLYAKWELTTYTLTVKYYSQNATHSTNLNISAPNCTLSSSSIAYNGSATVSHTYTTSSYSVTLTRANTSYSYYMRYGSAPTTSTYNGLNTFVYNWIPNANATINVYIYERYTISFNGNNYTGGSVPGSVYKIHGTGVTIPSNTLTRTGYTANGWNTNSSGTGTNYTTSYGVSTGSVTLYANWTPKYGIVNIQIRTSTDGVNYTNSAAGGTLSVTYYSSANNNPTSQSASMSSGASLLSVSNVLNNYNMTFSPVANNGYVYVGLSTATTPPAGSGEPSKIYTPVSTGTVTVYVFFNKLSTNQMKFSYEEDVPVSISSISYSNPATGYYGFMKNENGYFESQNKGVNNSYALCKVTFNANAGNVVTFSVINYAEANFDYAIFSNLNTILTSSYNVDTANVFKSFYGYNTDSVQTLSYTISTSGSNYVYVKFRKDGSNSNYNDSVQFKITSGQTYTVTNINNFNAGFKLNSSGYYESQNNELQTSFSLVKFSFYVAQKTTLTFDVISYGESCCDYGIFSNLNTTLSSNSNVDTVNVYKSYANLTSGSVQKLTYEVPAGSNFIYIKYRKDGSVNSYNDSLQFKVSSATKKTGYFYFEDGEYPQDYVGTSMNNTLNNAITSGTSASYNLLYNNGVEDIKIPVYSYNGLKYAALICPNSVSISLSGTTYSFVKYQIYYFKVSPIRWRVSDYGVMDTDYPVGWNNFGTYKSNFAVVSDKVLGFGAVNSQKTSEMWSSTSSNAHKNLSNQSELINLVYKSENVNVKFDYFGKVGQQIKVMTSESSYSGIKLADLEELNIYFSDKRAKASHMVAMFLGCDDDMINYWTRNLGDNLDNGLIETSSGIEISNYLNAVNAMRFSYVMKEGSRI